MTDEDLTTLDARAARSRRALASATTAVEVPPWRPRRRSVPRLLTIAAVVAVALVGAALVAIRGDRDDGLDVAAGAGQYFAPTETLGLPLRYAIRGDDLPATESPHVAVYSADPDFSGPGLTVVAQGSPPPLAIEDLEPGGDDERVVVNGSEGLLTHEPGSRLWNLTWEPEDGMLVYLAAQDMDRATVLDVASKVTINGDGEALLAAPEAFDLQEVIRGRMNEMFPGPAGGGFQRDGTMLRYGHQDGASGQLTLVASTGDERMMKAHRLVYPLAEDTEVNGAPALIAPIADVADPIPGESREEATSWVIVWQPDEETVLSIIGTDLTRADVTAVAESVRPISPDAFQRLADSDHFDPDAVLPGLEPSRLLVSRGELADGEPWRLEAHDVDSTDPVAITFTWAHDGSSTSSEIKASTPVDPLLLASRTTDVAPEHIYGFVAVTVDRLRWEAPDGGGGSLGLLRVGSNRVRYFVEALPEGVGPIVLIAEDRNGTELGRFDISPGQTIEPGMATTTTTSGQDLTSP